MLEFLATQMGFTIFSIEANMPEAYRLNDFVLNGTGDPVKLINGMYFWTWDTHEVLDMVLWMREYNQSGKGRIEFTGFDMQTPNVALGIVRDYVAKADPEYAATLTHAAQLALAPSTAPAAKFGTASGIFPVEPARKDNPFQRVPHVDQRGKCERARLRPGSKRRPREAAPAARPDHRDGQTAVIRSSTLEVEALLRHDSITLTILTLIFGFASAAFANDVIYLNGRVRMQDGSLPDHTVEIGVELPRRGSTRCGRASPTRRASST